MVIQVVMKGGRLAAMKFFRTEQDDDGRWEKKEKKWGKKEKKEKEKGKHGKRTLLLKFTLLSVLLDEFDVNRNIFGFQWVDNPGRYQI